MKNPNILNVVIKVKNNLVSFVGLSREYERDILYHTRFEACELNMTKNELMSHVGAEPIDLTKYEFKSLIDFFDNDFIDRCSHTNERYICPRVHYVIWGESKNKPFVLFLHGKILAVRVKESYEIERKAFEKTLMSKSHLIKRMKSEKFITKVDSVYTDDYYADAKNNYGETDWSDKYDFDDLIRRIKCSSYHVCSNESNKLAKRIDDEVSVSANWYSFSIKFIK